MKTKLKKLKDWSIKNRKALRMAGIGVVTTITVVLFGKGISKIMADREKELLEIVTNNLKLQKDGEFVDVIVKQYSDDYTRTEVIRRWTKKAGEILYLGKTKNVYELSDEQKIGKQIDKVGRSIASAMYSITKS